MGALVWMAGVLGYGLLLAAVLAPLLRVARRERRRRAACRPLVLTDDLPVDYAIAMLAAGSHHLRHVALARLHARGAIALTGGGGRVEVMPAPGAEPADDFESEVVGPRRDTGDEDRIVNALVDADLLRRTDGYQRFRWAPRATAGAMLVTAAGAAALVVVTPHEVAGVGILAVVALTSWVPAVLKDAVTARHGWNRYATTARGREHARTLAAGREGAGARVALDGMVRGHPDREVAALFRSPPSPTRPPRGEPDNFGGVGVGV
ncbi:hypothetical protein [Saccharothrix sp. HUAS TT1]|uniref:hypothetical protein n=1 Tax=unclassified Saccharothrix TaxID=2593673 RepID=UPI00345B5B07